MYIPKFTYYDAQSNKVHNINHVHYKEGGKEINGIVTEAFIRDCVNGFSIENLSISTGFFDDSEGPDKGVELFTNDIVHVAYEGPFHSGEYYGVIEYCESTACFYIDFLEHGHSRWLAGCYDNDEYHITKVGNYFQNRNLVEKGLNANDKNTNTNNDTKTAS